MTRRHNRHFNLDDDLIKCSGQSAYYQAGCNNWGKPNENGTYWCHHHKMQEKK